MKKFLMKFTSLMQANLGKANVYYFTTVSTRSNDFIGFRELLLFNYSFHFRNARSVVAVSDDVVKRNVGMVNITKLFFFSIIRKVLMI